MPKAILGIIHHSHSLSHSECQGEVTGQSQLLFWKSLLEISMSIQYFQWSVRNHALALDNVRVRSRETIHPIQVRNFSSEANTRFSLYDDYNVF